MTATKERRKLEISTKLVDWFGVRGIFSENLSQIRSVVNVPGVLNNNNNEKNIQTDKVENIEPPFWRGGGSKMRNFVLIAKQGVMGKFF